MDDEVNGGDEVGCEAGSGEQRVDAFELLAEGLIIDVVHDGGELGAEAKSGHAFLDSRAATLMMRPAPETKGAIGNQELTTGNESNVSKAD